MKNFVRVFALLWLLVSSPFALAGVVNINTADAQTLADNIYGVGQSRAQAIIDYREAHGPFQSVDDLVQVKGIGNKLLEKNRDNLIVEDDKPQPKTAKTKPQPKVAKTK